VSISVAKCSEVLQGSDGLSTEVSDIIRIPPEAWMFVCCECCVLSGRGIGDELITRPEESYRLWSVVVCDLQTSRMSRQWSALGRSATAKKKRIS
jgi:hypothetical protein